MQVSVYRSSLTGLRTVQIVIAGQPPPATTTRGNVAVTYPKHGPNTSRVLRALALLPQVRH